MAAIFGLFFFTSFTSRILSQAPGDGHGFCVDAIFNGNLNVFFTNITYPANERPLMDSRDYVTLLQGDNSPWQQVDNDNNNTDQVITHWTESTSLPCDVTVTVCGFSTGTQENWLITQHISRELAGGQRLPKVTAQFHFTLACDASSECSFEVFKWQTSTLSRTAARNTDSYERVGRVFPNDTSGRVMTNQTLDIELDAESGFYLAVVDLSTCIIIRHILVFYYVCVGETSDLITRPETIDVGTTVTGECVENSSPDGGPNPLVRCGDEGQWEIILPCRCNPGYERNGSQCSACREGTYSEGGDSSCQPCPANSASTKTGLSECPCVPGYYRAPGEGPSVACMLAGIVTMIFAPDSGSTVVSWSPPDPPNGVILYYNIRINNSDNGDLVAFIQEQNVTSIDVAVYGESGGKYTVEIQAVTSVGAGNFSSPVIVELDESSEPRSSSAVGITVAVIIIMLSVVVVFLIVCMYIIRSRRSKSEEKPSVDYEIPETYHYVSITPTIPLEHNTAYGMVSLKHPEMTENTPTNSLQECNTAYGMVSVQH